jgi:hypothetical protein
MRQTIVELLTMPEVVEIDFEPKKVVQVSKPAEF